MIDPKLQESIVEHPLTLRMADTLRELLRVTQKQPLNEHVLEYNLGTLTTLLNELLTPLPASTRKLFFTEMSRHYCFTCAENAVFCSCVMKGMLSKLKKEP